MHCTKCGNQMKQLFTSWYCDCEAANCDNAQTGVATPVLKHRINPFCINIEWRPLATAVTIPAIGIPIYSVASLLQPYQLKEYISSYRKGTKLRRDHDSHVIFRMLPNTTTWECTKSRSAPSFWLGESVSDEFHEAFYPISYSGIKGERFVYLR